MSRRCILALRPLGLGDLLTGVPALRALRRGFPDHTVLLACSPVLAPLAECSGAVDAVLAAEPLRPLGIRHPDIAVDLHGRGPASQRILLATEPERLIAFANDAVPATLGMPRWLQDEHEVARWCRLLSESGVAADPADLGMRFPSTPFAAARRGGAVVHPGAASGSRRWPADRFAAVARHLLEAGFRVCITGSAGERPLAETVARAAPGAESTAGVSSLLDLAALVQEAAVVVSGDTGCAHLATAAGTPSVVLFGPTPPSRWGPPASPRHAVLWRGLRGDPHGTSPDPGLLQIEVASVIAAVDAQLGMLAA